MAGEKLKWYQRLGLRRRRESFPDGSDKKVEVKRSAEGAERRQTRIGGITLQPPTPEEGIALQKKHGMYPVYKFNPTDVPIGPDANTGGRLDKPGDYSTFMAGSRSSKEWTARAEEVKKAHGGQYPKEWYQAVILSGLASETQKKW